MRSSERRTDRPGMRSVDPVEEAVKKATEARLQAELRARGLLGHGAEVDPETVAREVEPDPPVTPPIAFSPSESTLPRPTMTRKQKACHLGRVRASALGRKIGPTPYGYRRDAFKGILPNAAEVKTLRGIFRAYLLAKSTKVVAAGLNASGSKTRRGCRWSPQAVHAILKNETYCGLVVYQGKRVRGRHEALVSVVVFDRVKKTLRENDRRRPR